MTNAIPKGTCNLPVNLSTEERAVWGKLAFERDQSVGSLWRDAMLEWLNSHRPDLASTVSKIREHRREVIRTGAATFLLFCGLYIAGESMLPGHDDQEMYRTRGTVRVWRVRRLTEREEVVA